MEGLIPYLLLFIAAVLGGGLNAVAGGGSLIAFPSLVAFGVPLIPANATNSLALWPGSLGAILGFWEEIKGQRKLLVFMLIPSLIGGLLGAYILTETPPAVFKAVVPFLVLFATLLFALRDQINALGKRIAARASGGRAPNGIASIPASGSSSNSAREKNPVTEKISLRETDAGAQEEERIGLAGGIGGGLFQTAIAMYGGFFGAGQSIMMMASFSLMGMRDIHRINGLKTAMALSINGIAIVLFALKGVIRWDLGILMGIGGLLGGYVAARMSKRVDQHLLRLFVIVVGIVVSIWLFVKP